RAPPDHLVRPVPPRPRPRLDRPPRDRRRVRHLTVELGVVVPRAWGCGSSSWGLWFLELGVVVPRAWGCGSLNLRSWVAIRPSVTRPQQPIVGVEEPKPAV